MVVLLTVTVVVVGVPTASANADRLNSKEKVQQIKIEQKRFYHADGYIKAIGKNAHRTIYSSNPRIRHKWRNALRYLIKVRNNAQSTLYRIRHPHHVTSVSSASSYSSSYWVHRQIQVAELIAHSATNDPWPNCPDPVFNGASSWQDTVNCENRGNWYDSPGYYRCGLQFDPGWETKYGRLCP